MLTLERIQYVLERAPSSNPLEVAATAAECALYDKYVDDDTQVKCYALASMNEDVTTRPKILF